MNSLLETLRDIFPLIVADRIYYFFIKNHQITFKKELITKFNFKGVKGLLQIKNAIPAYWLINFEDQNIKLYSHTSKKIDIFNCQLKNILIENHLFIKKWRERNNNRTARLT